MSRDTVKTFAGLIIIGGIVVATFLYGNSQRQAQLAHDQDVKKQQDAKAQAQAKAASPAATSPAVAAATNNTNPVSSPSPNAIQGSATPTPGVVAGATATPTPTPAPAVASVPVTGGTGSALPETGPETAGALGLGSISVMLLAVRRSRQAMLKAARGKR